MRWSGFNGIYKNTHVLIFEFFVYIYIYIKKKIRGILKFLT
jgi:hypothetical protein